MALKDIKDKRYLTALFIFALIETVLATGVIYGWANMVLVFKFERFYQHFCPWLSSNSSQQLQQENRTDTNLLPYCPPQDKMFNTIFTIAAICFGLAMLPGGIMIDKRGPFVVSFASGVMYVAGALSLSFASIGYEDLLFPAFILFGLAGNLQAGSLFKVCRVAFQKRKSLVLCTLSGALDTSCVVFIIFKLMHRAGYGLQQISLQYACVCAVVIGSGLIFFIPRQAKFQEWIASEKTPEGGNNDIKVTDSWQSEKVIDGAKSEKNANSFRCTDIGNVNIFFVHDGKDTNMKKDTEETDVKKVDSETIAVEKDSVIPEIEKDIEVQGDRLREKTDIEHKGEGRTKEHSTSSKDEVDTSDGDVWISIISTLYVLHLLYLCTIHHLKLVYFVGSLADQLVRTTENENDVMSWHINVFGYFQLGGLLITPIVGLLFDRDTFASRNQQQEQHNNISEEEKRQKKLKQCIVPITINIFLSVTLCVLGLFENIALHIPQYILYTVVRGSLYSSHSAYVSVAFPGKQFGTLLGLGLFSASGASLLNYALFEITGEVFQGNSFYTNLILLVMVSSSIFHPLNIWRKSRP